jgi:hypothetical protein
MEKIYFREVRPEVGVSLHEAIKSAFKTLGGALEAEGHPIFIKQKVFFLPQTVFICKTEFHRPVHKTHYYTLLRAESIQQISIPFIYTYS